MNGGSKTTPHSEASTAATALSDPQQWPGLAGATAHLPPRHVRAGATTLRTSVHVRGRKALTVVPRREAIRMVRLLIELRCVASHRPS